VRRYEVATTKGFALSGAGDEAVTPELALVDPDLGEAQRQPAERKAPMSSTEPSTGAFFVDPAEPAPPMASAPSPEPGPLSVPPAEPTPAAPPAAVTPTATPMVDVPLGTLIFRAGLLAEEQLEDALQEGMATGKRLGEVLLERGLLHERDLGRMLAAQKGLPFVEVSGSDAAPEALQVLPEQKARLQVTLPLRYEGGQLVVAVADPSNELVLENLRRTLGSEPRLVVAAHSDLLRAIDAAYAANPTAAVVPAPAPAPAPAPPPAPAPEPQLQEPGPVPSLQPEPVQPPTPPAVTPLPTVLPPAEERSAEPDAAPSLQPLVTEPVAQSVEPQPLQPTEPPLEAPAPPPAMPAQPAVEPVEAQPLSEPAPEPQPVAPPPVEHPAEPAPLHLKPETPPAPELSTPVAPGPEPDAGSLHIVLLRLQDGDALEIGAFHTWAEAAARAQEAVRQIAAAEGEAAWPFFAERYLRPQAIISVELVAEQGDKWMGSATRSRWAKA